MRYIVEEIQTGKFVDLDLPLADVQVKTTLSGPQVISGRLPLDTKPLTDLQLTAWGHYIHVEEDGKIMATGILMPTSIDESGSLAIECEGVSTYPHGLPFMGDYQGIQVDPMDVVAMIWKHIESFPFSIPHIQLDGTECPIRIGTEPKQVEFETGAGEQVSFEAGPYKLSWFDWPDCGSEIDKLAQDTPFDYIERQGWNKGKTAIVKTIEMGYPRIGRKREDLTFRWDENIISAVPALEDGEVYANHVIMAGAGEGRDQVWQSAQDIPPTGRIRRALVVKDGSVRSRARAKKIAEDYLSRHKSLISVSSITIDGSHPNAELGSFVAGDDILVEADLPWIGRISLWHRVVAYTWAPETSLVNLELIRSDNFRYGYNEKVDEPDDVPKPIPPAT